MKKSIFAFIALFLCVFNIPVFAAGVKAKDYEVVHRYVMNDGVIMEICTEAKAPQWFKLAAAHASLDSNSTSWQKFSPYKDGNASKAFIVVNQLECTAELDEKNNFTGLFNSEIKSFLGSPFLDYWADEASLSRKNSISYNAIADFSEINDEIKNPVKSERTENDPDNLFKVVAYRKGPDFEYDPEKNITTLKLDDDLIEIFPDHETINQIKKSKQIKLLDRYTDPVSRIVDKIFTINFDTTKEKFLKYFNLKE